MINKRSLWFLTLFSLVLVLSIYYITMPSELLLTNGTKIKEKNNSNVSEEPTISKEESSILVALRVEADSEMSKEIEDLKLVLTNTNSSVEEKNKAYEKIKELNNSRSEEENIENQIKEKHKLESFVKISNDQINITINSEKHNSDLANQIMRTVQANYKEKKYITVKFQK